MIKAEQLREYTTQHIENEFNKQLTIVEDQCKEASLKGQLHAVFNKVVAENVWWHVLTHLTTHLGYRVTFQTGSVYMIDWSK